MFAIHAPQTVTLSEPGTDGPAATINFKTNGADTSRCVMEIASPDGCLHRFIFNTRGHLVDQQFIAPTDDPAGPEPVSQVESEPEPVDPVASDNANTADQFAADKA